MYGYTMNKKAVSDRLPVASRRIDGQVRGIHRMVEEDQYCVDILTQVNSAASALKSVGMGVLDDHVRHCVKESVESGDSEEELEELLRRPQMFRMMYAPAAGHPDAHTHGPDHAEHASGPAAVDEGYACPMHPEVRGGPEDRCPKCGMLLERRDDSARS